MKALNDLVTRVSQSGWLFIFSAIFAFGSLFIVFMNINVAFEPIVGAQLFDFQNDLTVEEIFEQLESFNESAVALYYAFVFVDFFFPFFAGLVLAAAGAYAIRHLSTKWYKQIIRLNLFAIFFIPTLFDWGENIFAITVINGYPNELMAAATLLVLAKKGKLTSVMIMQLVVWSLLALALLKWMGQKVGLLESEDRPTRQRDQRAAGDIGTKTDEN
jgi:hypothetical protein